MSTAGVTASIRSGAGVRAVLAAVAVGALGVFVSFWGLGAAEWTVDEVTYAGAGRLLVRGDSPLLDGFTPLVPLILGLSQAVFGDTLVAARLPAAAAGALTGVVLAALAHAVAGRRAALATGLLWFVVPFGMAPDGVLAVRMARAAMVDVFMGLFLASAALAGWHWRRSPTLSRGIVTGVLLGLAVASKPTALVVVPVVVAFATGGRREWRQASVALGVAGCVAVAPFLVFGREALDALVHTAGFQVRHAQVGHPVPVGGALYDHPPWWAHLSWWLDQVPVALAAALVALVAVGAWRHRRAAALLVGSSAALFALLAFATGFGLPHHAYAWQPFLVTMAGVGAAAVWSTGRPRLVPVARLALVALGLVLAAGMVGEVGEQEPPGYRRAAAALGEAGVDTVGVVGYDGVLRAYLDPAVDARFLHDEADIEGFDAVVVDDLVAGRRGPSGASLARVTSGWGAERLGRLEVLTPPVDIPTTGAYVAGEGARTPPGSTSREVRHERHRQPPP